MKRSDTGADPDIFHALLGFGGLGNPFLADIVNAGWLPRSFFEAVGGPGGGRGILAFSVTFIFVDDAGNPTDINGDNYLDSALNEVYYNDNFGNPGGDRARSPWAINAPPPAIDMETVALHENGHSRLGLNEAPVRKIRSRSVSPIGSDSFRCGSGPGSSRPAAGQQPPVRWLRVP